jgi:ribonucleotide monophosphatase NagD (HAD superfamily)
MPRILLTTLTLCVLFLTTTHTARADDTYTVPLTIAGASYTLTVTVETSGITVEADSPAVTVGEIAAVQTADELAAQQSLDEQKAQAVAIAYDDLFRNNEKHVGKIVRYVGQGGADYYARNIDPAVTDAAGKVFSAGSAAGGYVQPLGRVASGQGEPMNPLRSG